MEIKPREQNHFFSGGKALETPAFLIYGPEGSGRSNVLKKLSEGLNKSWAQGQAEILNFYEDDVVLDNNKFVTECTAMGFFSSKKIIILKTTTNQLAELVSETISGLISDCKLIIFAENLDTKSKLRALGKQDNLTALPCYKAEARDVNSIVREELQKKNIQANYDVINLIVEKLGNKPANIPSELEKLYIYTGGANSISIDDVENCFCEYSAIEIRDLCHAIAKKQQQQINTIADNLEINESAVQLARTLSLLSQKLLDIQSRAQESNISSAIEKIFPKIFFKDKPIYSDILQKVKDDSELYKLVSLAYNLEKMFKANPQAKNLEFLTEIRQYS